MQKHTDHICKKKLRIGSSMLLLESNNKYLWIIYRLLNYDSED